MIKKYSMFTLIRTIILLSIVLNIAIILYSLFVDTTSLHKYSNPDIASRFELLILSSIVYGSTFITGIIEKRERIEIPTFLEIIIVLFIYASLILSAQFNLYYTVWWWDDLLHFISSLITSSIAFLLIFKLNLKYSLRFNPFLIAIFTFSFSVSIGVLWEILEFTSDVFLGTAHQHWNDSVTFMIGKAYQGFGLRDTMSDLILTCIGATIMSIFFSTIYSFHKKKLSIHISGVVKEPVELS